ncbi:biotin synthase, partial [Francisella tularensis subsp. holarctica]|nr:biotin synthase [Francisella tularensis subsp. holarctica]
DLYLDFRFSNCRELANHLKSTGVNTYSCNDNKQNFSSIRKLCLISNHINLSYHVGLFICFNE